LSDYGFTIIKNFRIDPSFNFLTELRFESKQGVNYFFGHNSFQKFKNDKLFDENKNFIIGLDGVILNLLALKNEYAISEVFLLIMHLYNKRKQSLAIELKGDFNGFIFDKNTEELVFFNNKVAAKQIFYCKVEKSIIITPSLKNIVKFKQQLNIKSYLNVSACYNMLTYGGMIEDQTLIENVKKLNAGQYLEIISDKLKLNKYFDFNNVEYSLIRKNEAIDLLNEGFKNAILLEYKKDEEYNYSHLATLSGGLDSRLNVMLASALGFSIDIFCFSQSNYLDEKIARSISKDLDLDFKFVALDNGDYLQDLVENVELNNGLQFYLNAAHFNKALKSIDLENYGLIHTGLAGDGVLGGFLTKRGLPDYYSNKISNKFIGKLNNDISIEKEFKNEEVFKLYQRVFNITNFGSYVVETHKTYLVSPFLDEDFLITALSIDPKLKKDQIYLDWLNKKHSIVTKYVWEKTGFKPDAKYKTKLSRYTNRIKKEFLILTKQQNKLSMTPEDYWLKSNLKNQEFYNTIFKERIELFVEDKELFTDLNFAFKHGNINEKSAVLTILEIVYKFKLKI